MNRTATMSVYIVDLDGTIANNEHRLHLLKDNLWEQYFEAAEKDEPYDFMVPLIRALYLNHPRLYICTTRTEDQREMTEAWLERYDIPYDTLLMTQNGDKRSHAEIKSSMVDFIRGDGYEIILAIDDRPSVVKMFRDKGVPCLAMCDQFWKLPWNKDE